MKTRHSTPAQPVSTTSPLAITMLLHFYAVCEPFISRPIATWPNAQRGIVESFLVRRLIEPTDYGYRTTDAGSKLARKLRLQFELLMMDVSR